ncbi:MAG: adenylate/guanylate cyclase domain-containing protein [Methylohalobius sp. ZOD2]
MMRQLTKRQNGLVVNAKPAVLFILLALLVGVAVDAGWGTAVDDWVHDPALVHQARTRWRHVAIVVLDDEVPLQVGRKQALPLFARAAERLIRAGAKGVFLDARLSKEMEAAMPYALCMEAAGTVRWSAPRCATDGPDRCVLSGSPAGLAPLAMPEDVLERFRVAPYLPGQAPLPDFLLYGWEASAAIPPEGLVAEDRLVSRGAGVMRWLDLSADHAAVRLAAFVDPERTARSLARTRNDEICGEGYACRRIRLSRPTYRIHLDDERTIAPVSLLAACDEQTGMRAAKLLRGKAVILQLTMPAEATDMIVTPMTTAWGGPHLLTPGAHYLADAVETLLQEDHPRPPPLPIKLGLFLVVAASSVVIGLQRRQAVLWGVFPVVAGVMIGLCFFIYPVQLWPVTAALATYLTGAVQIVGLNLVIGLREGKLIRRYMPPQIHDLLISVWGDQRFRNRRHRAVVLMSDLAGYTTVTHLLGDPAYVLELMNDYLEETSVVLQEKYQGWLEAYVGDLVCYYWPIWGENQSDAYGNALQGAAELARLQKRFFAGLNRRYRERFPAPALERVAEVIDAGIGMTSGTVVMGDLGPKQGVRKFGILGDPLNLAARLESLTRYFNSDLIVSEEVAVFADQAGLIRRRLGRIQVKGKLTPVTVFALGDQADARFSASCVHNWEKWLSDMERGGEPTIPCPEIYAQDRDTLNRWKKRGLLRDGVWHLDEK